MSGVVARQAQVGRKGDTIVHLDQEIPLLVAPRNRPWFSWRTHVAPSKQVLGLLAALLVVNRCVSCQRHNVPYSATHARSVEWRAALSLPATPETVRWPRTAGFHLTELIGAAIRSR
jgi:hypothetical protein